jgi:uncharacterized membrane protein YccC
MSEPANSIALVLIGALLGAWFAGCWCGCLPRWRWRRSWRQMVERNGGVFEEAETCRRDHTTRFIMAEVAKRNAERAAQIKEAGTR